MLEIFYPKEWVESVYGIVWEDWYRRGIRGVIFDIDNTLVPHDEPADSRALNLFARLCSLGMQTCLLSNNRKTRVASFAKETGASFYIYKSGKPGTKNYDRAMELMGTDRMSTIFVGDQLFTDVWGANRAGVYSILVNPLNPKEEIQIVLKRYPEKLVLHFYKKKLQREEKSG